MDFYIMCAAGVVILSMLIMCVKKRNNFYTDEEIEAGLENIKRKSQGQPRVDCDERKPSYLRRDTFLF